jgi:hypothetical protein
MPGDMRFIVSLHDVEPAAGTEVTHLLEELRGRVGNAISAAVIAARFGRTEGSGLAAVVRECCREMALHGYSHSGAGVCHPLGYLTGNAHEFVGLCAAEAQARLEQGQQILRDVFGRSAEVFVPPAWCLGPVTVELANLAGLSVLVTLMRLATRTVELPLATYSWDCGRFAALGYIGEALGCVRRRFSGAIPCVVLHPADVARGWDARGLRVIDDLLEEGYRPATFGDAAGLRPGVEGCALSRT